MLHLHDFRLNKNVAEKLVDFAKIVRGRVMSVLREEFAQLKL